MQADQDSALLRRHAQDALIPIEGSRIVHWLCVRSDRTKGRRYESDESRKDGAEVYAKICAFCHEAKVGPTIRGRGPDPAYIRFIVRQGNRAMPAFRAAEINDESLAKVAEYVSKKEIAR